MCNHEWQIGAVVAQGECNEGGDIMVFGGTESSGEPGAVCQLCALIWGTIGEYDRAMLYAIEFLKEANFPYNVSKE